MAVKRYNGTNWEVQAGNAGAATDATPPGVITMFAGSTAPSGYLLCNGSAVNRSTYSVLFGIIGTTYGVGDGSSTFNLPNLKGKVPVGLDSTQTEFDALGETGGAKTHTLTSSEMPSHLHSVDPPSTVFNTGTESADHSHGDDHLHGGATGSVNRNASHGHIHRSYEWTATGSGSGRVYYSRNSNANSGSQIITPGGDNTDTNHEHGVGTNSKSAQGYGTNTGGVSANHYHGVTVDIAAFNSASTGSGAAHNNLQPYIVLNYIIKT